MTIPCSIEPIEAQLTTIRDIIPSTVGIYRATKTIKSIIPNLTMIQTAIDTLIELSEKEPTESIDLGVKVQDVPNGIETTCTQTDNHHVIITLEGRDIYPGIFDVETFGSIPNAIDVVVSLPIVCGKYYKVKQVNSMLAYYDGKDEYVSQDSNGDWIKEKTYFIKDEDILEYAFLVGDGRNNITININDGDVVIEIITHIHFSK